MGISVGGMNDYSDYGKVYQNYRMPEIKPAEAEEAQQVQTQEIAQTTQEQPAESTSSVQRHDAALEDVSLTFNKQDDYGYIGKDSDILSLDVEKAVSDMRKDQILQQYQYFVGGRY